ncbi:hypothetical protein, partial [Opacimonas viscosa]
QARGVVIYQDSDISDIKARALAVQNQLNQENGSIAANLRAAALRELKAQPYAIWGLQHNWLDMENNHAACTFTKLTENKVPLKGGMHPSG